MKPKKSTHGAATPQVPALPSSEAIAGAVPENVQQPAPDAAGDDHVVPASAAGVAVLAALRLKVDGSLSFRIANLEAVELTAIATEVPRYFKALLSARSRIARAAKIRARTMPILVSIAAGEIIMSIVTPRGKDPASVLDGTRELCGSIMEQWRTTTESASQALGGAREPPDQVRTAPARGTDERVGGTDIVPVEVASAPTGGAEAQQPPASPLPVDPMIKHLLEALMARSRGGNLSMNFSSAGQPDTRPAIIVPQAPPAPIPVISLGDLREIEGQVCHRIGAAHCIVREPGVSKQKKASFSTSDRLSTIINMLIGCPPVVFEVRDCLSDRSDANARQDYIIYRLVGLTDQWFGESSVLDHLQSCLDEIRTLLVDSPGPALG